MPNDQPTCSTCPNSAIDPLQPGAPRQCRAKPPTVFAVPTQNVAGGVALQMISTWPQEKYGPCGEHPVIRARAQIAYEEELKRLRESAGGAGQQL